MAWVRSAHTRITAGFEQLSPAVWLVGIIAAYILLWLARLPGPFRHGTPITVYWLQGLWFFGSTSTHLSDEGRGMARATLAWGLALLAACLAIEVASVLDPRFLSVSLAPLESDAVVYLLLADALYFAFVLPWAAGRGAGILLDWVLPLETMASEGDEEEDA